MKRAILACTFVLLAGCGTPYQPFGLGGGYSETPLAPGVFRVFFNGNGFTSKERAEDFALLRAAELTIAANSNHFTIIDDSSYIRVDPLYTTPGYSDTQGSLHLQHDLHGTSFGMHQDIHGTSSGTYSEHTTYSPPETYFLFSPRIELVIQCFPDKQEGIYTFDAAFLRESLKKKYKVVE